MVTLSQDGGQNKQFSCYFRFSGRGGGSYVPRLGPLVVHQRCLVQPISRKERSVKAPGTQSGESLEDSITPLHPFGREPPLPLPPAAPIQSPPLRNTGRSLGGPRELRKGHVMTSQPGVSGSTGSSSSCLVCHKAVGIRQSDGRLRAHGPAHNHCPGSEGPATSLSTPPPSTSLDQSQDLFDSILGNPLPSTFKPTLPSWKILKRIPRGARDAVAAQFQASLNSVLQQPK